MNSSTSLPDFFSSLSSEAQQIFKAGEGVWEERKFSPDTYVFKEGDSDHDLYFILSGEVEIIKQIRGKESTQKLLAVLSAGGVFGEGALLSAKLRSASVRTLQATEVLILTQAKFEELIHKKPTVAATLLLNLLLIVNQRLMKRNIGLNSFNHQFI